MTCMDCGHNHNEDSKCVQYNEELALDVLEENWNRLCRKDEQHPLINTGPQLNWLEQMTHNHQVLGSNPSGPMLIYRIVPTIQDEMLEIYYRTQYDKLGQHQCHNSSIGRASHL